MKSHSYRLESMHKKSMWIYLGLPLGLVIVAGVIALLLYMNGYFYTRKDVHLPHPSISAEIKEIASASSIDPGNMLSRTVSLLVKNTKTSPYIASWYALPGSINSIPALQSSYLWTDDQVLLLRCYIDSGKQDAAATLMKAIERDFTAENGYLVSYRKCADISDLPLPQPQFEENAAYEDIPVTSTYSLEATAAYLRAALEYYDKWGQPSDWSRIQRLAELLYADGMIFPEDITIEVAMPSGVPIQDNRFIVSVIEEEVPSAGSFTTIALSSLDLQVFRMLSEIDSKYQPLYDRGLEILDGAMISEDLPLYAFGYSQSTNGYVNFSGENPQVELIPSLKVTLYLAEEGKASPAAILWIKEQLFNEDKLFQSYNILSGNPSELEAGDAYGIVLQIARITGDSELYAKAMLCLERNVATSYTSEARSAIFRSVDPSRIVVYAKDNLEACLGM